MSPRPGSFMHRKTHCECRTWSECMHACDLSLVRLRQTAQRWAVRGPLLTVATAPGLSGIASRSPASSSAMSAAGLSSAPASTHPASCPDAELSAPARHAALRPGGSLSLLEHRSTPDQPSCPEDDLKPIQHAALPAVLTQLLCTQSGQGGCIVDAGLSPQPANAKAGLHLTLPLPGSVLKHTGG